MKMLAEGVTAVKPRALERNWHTTKEKRRYAEWKER